jgi:hypothetical protein
MFWAHASIGLAIDTVLFITPLWIIYSRMMFSATKKRVLLLFSVGLLVVVTGAVRLGSAYPFSHCTASRPHNSQAC